MFTSNGNNMVVGETGVMTIFLHVKGLQRYGVYARVCGVSWVDFDNKGVYA